jgi:hypothetical protein
MLFYQIYDIDYGPNYTQLKPKMSTIREQLADGARRTVIRSKQLDLRSETELRIQVKELLLDDACLSKVVEDKKSWFTRMEVLDLIYQQFSSRPISWGTSQRHPSISNTSFPRL